MIDLRLLTNVGTIMGTSPFFPRGAGGMVFINQTAGSLIVQGSADNGVLDAWATYVTVPANAMIEGAGDLPQWLRVSTVATVSLLS